MAIGTLSDMKLYEEQFFGGVVETLERELNVFNQASNNTIRLITDIHKGQFEQESFFKYTSGLIQHRNPATTSASTPVKLAQDEFIRPKIKKYVHVEQTIDALKTTGLSPDMFPFIVGQQAGPEIAAQYLESAMSALIGSFKIAAVQTNLTVDSTSDDLDTVDLTAALAKMGDKASRIKLWVMHSKVFYDLLDNQIAQKIDGISSFNIFQALPVTLGRPVLVVDSPALLDAGSSTASSADDVYYTFGLTEGAVTVKESEERSVLQEIVGGNVNLLLRFQAEYAYDVGVKGMKWNTATTNPTDANLGTNTNWSKIANDYKSLPGVAIRTR